MGCVSIYASLRQDNSRAKNLINLKSDKVVFMLLQARPIPSGMGCVWCLVADAFRLAWHAPYRAAAFPTKVGTGLDLTLLVAGARSL